jgi:hypothetical protein
MKLMRIDKPIGTDLFKVLIYVPGWSPKLSFIQLVTGMMDNDLLCFVCVMLWDENGWKSGWPSAFKNLEEH